LNFNFAHVGNPLCIANAVPFHGAAGYEKLFLGKQIETHNFMTVPFYWIYEIGYLS